MNSPTTKHTVRSRIFNQLWSKLNHDGTTLKINNPNNINNTVVAIV